MKLQPNFSWQKYEGSPENKEEQFQYQLQTQHILVANSLNTTIDDLSYWTRERPTGFTWINGKQLFTKTLAIERWTAVGTLNTIPHGVAGTFTIVLFTGYLKNGTTQYPLPYLDAVTGANSVGMNRTGANIILTSGGTDMSAFTGYVTIYYVKE